MTADKPPAGDGPTSGGTHAGAEDETKRRFREALDAKQKGRKGQDHLDGGAQQSQPHGPVETKRTFRRKTG